MCTLSDTTSYPKFIAGRNRVTSCQVPIPICRSCEGPVLITSCPDIIVSPCSRFLNSSPLTPRLPRDLNEMVYCFHTRLLKYVSLSQNSLIFNSTDKTSALLLLSIFVLTLYTWRICFSCRTVIGVYQAQENFAGFLFLPRYNLQTKCSSRCDLHNCEDASAACAFLNWC